MKVIRETLALRHEVKFPRPAASLPSQSGRLIELVLGELEGYAVRSSDVIVRSTGALDGWSLALVLFNHQCNIVVTVDGMTADYRDLSGDQDIDVVVDVQARLLLALSKHTPTLALSFESLVANLQYNVVGGADERLQYFSAVSFPGRDESHFDASIRFRMRHPTEPKVVGAFEFAPGWDTVDKILFMASVNTSEVTEKPFAARAQLVRELNQKAFVSLQLSE